MKEGYEGMKKTQSLRKITSVLLIIAICLFGTTLFNVDKTYALTQSEFDQKLSSLRSQYPNYSTWTGTFNGGKQCYGFAHMIGNTIFGSLPSSWTKVYSINDVKAGDLIQYGNTSGSGHTIFVTGVSGDTITFLDCNGNGNYSGGTKVRTCGIKWDNTIQKSAKMFKKYSFSYLLSSPGISSEPVVEQGWVDIGTGFYARIINASYYKFLTDSNDDVRTYSENGNSNQVWRFDRNSDGSYQIQNVASGKVLDVSNAGSDNGTNVWVCDSNHTDAQKWYIYGSQWNYSLRPGCAPKCRLDVQDGFQGENGNIWIFEKNDSGAQKFTIQKTGEGTIQSKNVGDDFYAYIINTAAWKHLTSDGNNVTMRNETGKAEQVWHFQRQSDNSYKIISCLDGKILDVTNAGTEDGTNLGVCGNNDGNAQRWYIYGESGAYYFRARCGELVIDIPWGSTADGENVWMWTYNGGGAQKFQILGVTMCNGVSLDCSNKTLLGRGNTLQLTGTVSPSDASYRWLAWSSSNTGVATVDANGLVTAVGEGSATITARTQDGSNVSAACQITVAEPPSYTSISTDKTVYRLSDTVRIAVNASHVAGGAIGIDKAGVGRVVTEDTEMTYSIDASKLGAGKYSAYFTLWNSVHMGNIDTSRVEFTIECDNHSYTSEITKQPTCTTTGEKVFTCTVCGASRTETILATGHQHTEIRNAKSATAEQDGYTGDTYCKDCNTKLSSGTVIKKLSVTGKASLSEVTAGNSVTITATASGGKSGYTYSFLIHNLETDKWFRVAEFGKSNQYVWTASGSGNREFFAEVKDSNGTVIRSEAVKVTVKAKSVPLSVSGTVSAAEVTSGKTVTIRANAAGGTGSYTYSFLIHNLENDTWYRWSFDKNAQHVWTASGSGSREFFAEAKDSAGTVIRSSAMKVTVKKTATPLTITGKVSASQVAAGNTVTISASAEGGTGSYTYSFLIHNLENDSWYRWSFDKNAQHVWTASGSGSREFFAEAKDSAGTVVRSAAMKVMVASGSTGTLQIQASADKNQVTVGSAVTVKASATGGSGSYTYSFLVHNQANDSWYRFGDFAAASSYTWTAGNAGTREFFVEVKDGNGTVVRSSAVIVNVK